MSAAVVIAIVFAGLAAIGVAGIAGWVSGGVRIGRERQEAAARFAASIRASVAAAARRVVATEGRR